VTLEAFLRAEVNKAYAWGENDCASRVDRWVTLKTGVSPKARSGADYSTIKSGWPVIRAMLKGMAGFERVDEPQAGFVGLIAFRGIIAPAIFGGTNWIAWNEAGMIVAASPRAFRVWKV
jgi:hypothetical protein